jgi:hypothetical protein
MKDKLIYRVEDETGSGPYNGLIGTQAFHNLKRNPPPGRDPLLNEPGVLADYLPPPMLLPSTFVFGFSHAEQAQSWFYNPKIIEREKWEKYGAHVEVYKVDRRAHYAFVEAKAQTVFVRPHTRDLGSLPLSDLWTKTPAQIEAEAANLIRRHHD